MLQGTKLIKYSQEPIEINKAILLHGKSETSEQERKILYNRSRVICHVNLSHMVQTIISNLIVFIKDQVKVMLLGTKLDIALSTKN